MHTVTSKSARGENSDCFERKERRDIVRNGTKFQAREQCRLESLPKLRWGVSLWSAIEAASAGRDSSSFYLIFQRQ